MLTTTLGPRPVYIVARKYTPLKNKEHPNFLSLTLEKLGYFTFSNVQCFQCSSHTLYLAVLLSLSSIWSIHTLCLAVFLLLYYICSSHTWHLAVFILLSSICSNHTCASPSFYCCIIYFPAIPCVSPSFYCYFVYVPVIPGVSPSFYCHLLYSSGPAINSRIGLHIFVHRF